MGAARADKRSLLHLPLRNEDVYDLTGVRRRAAFLQEHLPIFSAPVREQAGRALGEAPSPEDVERVVRHYLGTALGRMVVAASRNTRIGNDTDCDRSKHALERHVRVYASPIPVGEDTPTRFGAHTLHFCALKHGQQAHYFAVLQRRKHLYLVQTEKGTYDVDELVRYLDRAKGGATPFRVPTALFHAFVKLCKGRDPPPVPRRMFTRLFHYAPSDAESFAIFQFAILSSYNVEPLYRKSRLDSLRRAMDVDADLIVKTNPISALTTQVMTLELE